MPDTVEIFDPQGTLRDVPYEQMRDAIAAGGKPAIKFQAPDNSIRFVPADQMHAAARAGGKPLPLQDQSVQHPGFWASLGSDLWGMAKGLPQMVAQSVPGVSAFEEALPSSIQGKLGYTPIAQRQQETAAAMLSRKQEGRSLAYRTIAPAAEAVGVNVRGMEQSANEGDIGGVWGHAAAVPTVMAASEGLARGVPALSAVAKDAIQTNLPAIESVASKVPLVKSFVDGSPADMVTRAVKPGKNNVGWNDAVTKALPNIKAAERQLGRPITSLDDALEATTLAKKQIWQQYADRLGPAAKMGSQIDGNAVSDAMANSIDKRTALQNPGLVDRVQKVADTYRRPLGMDEAEDFLQSVNKDLNSYYAKNKVGRQVALNDPEMASTVAEGEALRQALYSKLDEVSGPGALDLKRQYGALTNIEKEMTGRQNVAARQQPQSLQEQLTTARGYGKIAKGVFTMSPGDVIEGAESVAASKWLKDRNSTDALISRAFDKVQPSQPMPAPTRPMIRGLLPRGPIPMGSGPDTSGSVPFTPPAFNYTTRAQRLGLLLPERTATAIPLPPTSADYGLFGLLKSH